MCSKPYLSLVLIYSVRLPDDISCVLQNKLFRFHHFVPLDNLHNQSICLHFEQRARLQSRRVPSAQIGLGFFE